MKVKEILEILNVPEIELLTKLNNVGITADLETEIEPDIIKKLSKVYKVDIKAPKAKKAAPKPVVTPKAPVEIVEESKVEPVVEKKEQPKPVIKEPVKEEQKKVEPKEKKPIPVKEPVSKPQPTSKPGKAPEAAKANKPQPKVQREAPEEELELTRVYDDKYTDYETEGRIYTRIKNIKKKQSNKGNRQTNFAANEKAKENVLIYTPGMTVAQVADGLNVPIGEIVRKLVMLGYMVNATQILERDVIEILADEYRCIVKDKITEDITKFEEIVIEDDENNLVSRPPIVTIMGHVDHGKTTLLDTIRHSKVVSSEAGGITQHIGAYQVRKNGKLITFIDTPGHAAFSEMRARGANVTDIVVLVVAADDGVMPQTREAIDHAKAAKVPIIVAINKMDKLNANPDRIKQELSTLGLVPEEWGGKTIYVPISALKGQGVEELLEMVLLTAEMENFRANPNRLGVGTVIEARLDKGRGPVATLLVKNGTIKIGDPLVIGNTYGKIRAMQDETKAQFKSAGPAKAVEVTGLESVPLAGDHFMVFEDEKTARLVAEERSQRAFNIEMGVGKPVSLANLFEQMNDANKELNLIIKGDVQGSIEAIKGSLEKIAIEGVKINVVRSSVGAVTETDINLALASQSIIIAFNVRPSAKVMDYAKEKNIEIRLYNIIYKVLEDIEAAMKGMLDPVYEEKVLGQAEVRTLFKASKIGTIAGCYVTDGVIVRNSDIRLIRDSIVVYEGKLSSLKRFKDDTKEVKAGYECGLTIENYNDIKEGDIIEAYSMERIK
ncbi:MAG: translation initiation factor IF-2 [Acholeplasmataceae bacterium]|nr:translation initiation factor IF-2 [Acholeplasmataceae bacterium]